MDCKIPPDWRCAPVRWLHGLRFAAMAIIGAMTFSPAMGAPPVGQLEQITGKVVVVDSGDTLVVTTDTGKLTLRLSDIGAPQGSDFYAPSARTLLANMALDQTVRVVVTGRNGADRIYGHAYVGELDVNLELVKRGAAWMCLEFTTTTDYMPFQNEAIRRRWGVWSRTTTFDAWVRCRARPPIAPAAAASAERP